MESCHYPAPAKSQSGQGLQVRETQATPTRLPGATPTQTPTASITLPEPGQQGRQDESHRQWDSLLQRPMDEPAPALATPHSDPFTSPGNLFFPLPLGPTVTRLQLLAILPPPNCCDYLVTEYFMRLSPLFHILHGPTFQKQYNAFRQDSSRTDLSWVALLFTICSATVNTMQNDDSVLEELWPQHSDDHDIVGLAHRFRTAAMMCLSQDQFMIRHSLSTLEALLILIYTICNHEGAERAWTLLGKHPVCADPNSIR